MPNLSVIIITKNEAKNIRRCLESIKWAEEIIILDSGSTDDTVTICREYTDKIFISDWPGFGPQKNRALNKASGEWVFSIDADEEVPPALSAEIQQAIQQAHSIAGYYIKRVSTYCGKVIRYGDWRSDKVLRLFKKVDSRFSDDIVHERVMVNGSLATLQHELKHFPFENLSQVLDKINSYSSYGAQKKFEQGKTASLLTAITHGLWAFLRGYIFRLGLLDGREGFLLAFSNALGTFYRYMKLVYLCKTF